MGGSKQKKQPTKVDDDDQELHWTQWRNECKALRAEKKDLTAKCHEVMNKVLEYYEVKL